MEASVTALSPGSHVTSVPRHCTWGMEWQMAFPTDGLTHSHHSHTFLCSLLCPSLIRAHLISPTLHIWESPGTVQPKVFKGNGPVPVSGHGQETFISFLLNLSAIGWKKKGHRLALEHRLCKWGTSYTQLWEASCAYARASQDCNWMKPRKLSSGIQAPQRTVQQSNKWW